jgi:predicted adenine nucleotide alpha hydrolase (AANH) superfamily ATPase
MRSVLLHACCAPCATHSVEVLATGHRVTLFFANSNISPRTEYDKRLAEARRLADRVGIPLVEDAYDHDAWLTHIRGLEREIERGRRCEMCFEFNLRHAADYARDHGFDYFSTTLTISPHKDSGTIFRVGESLGPFLAVDMKKNDGFRRATELTRAYGLYRQDYCGCEFSRRPDKS